MGSVFSQQQIVHQPFEKTNNDSRPNPVCSSILTSMALESSGDSEVIIEETNLDKSLFFNKFSLLGTYRGYFYRLCIGILQTQFAPT